MLWYPAADRFQLFDLAADPDEVNDLSADPAQVATLADMKKLLAAQQNAFGDRLAVRPK